MYNIRENCLGEQCIILRKFLEYLPKLVGHSNYIPMPRKDLIYYNKAVSVPLVFFRAHPLLTPPPVYSIYRDFPKASRNFGNILERSARIVVHKNWTRARGAMLRDGSSAAKRREPV